MNTKHALLTIALVTMSNAFAIFNSNSTTGLNNLNRPRQTTTIFPNDSRVVKNNSGFTNNGGSQLSNQNSMLRSNNASQRLNAVPNRSQGIIAPVNNGRMVNPNIRY